jgi:uncharacterized membrane protein
MEGIFKENKAGTKIKISDLKNKFYTHLPAIKKSVMDQVIKDEYFPHNPTTIRGIYTGIGTVMIVIAFQIMTVAIDLLVGILVSGIIIIIIGQFLPRKTKKGTETYYVLKGLYEYIDTAEKDRMEFQEKNGILFEKLLPYAIAFGLVKKWAKAFEDIIKTPPNWYTSKGQWYAHFTMMHLANNLSSFNNTLSTNISSRPGSRSSGGWSGSSGFSGGGFSGGGFGGGGGRGL